MNTITVIRGDDVTLNVAFKDNDGNSIDITGYTVFFTVKDNLATSDDAGALIAKTVTSHSLPSQGQTIINLSNTDTNLPEGIYHYDFQTKDIADKISSTERGVFAVNLDVTKRTA
jgi:hypothetical protein